MIDLVPVEQWRLCREVLMLYRLFRVNPNHPSL
jgi:hypothetical protein